MCSDCRKRFRFQARPALGTRKYLGEHKPEGAKVPLMMFGETEWLTYGETGEMSKAFGRGLLELGMTSLPQGVDLEKHNGPSTIMLYEVLVDPS